MDRFGGRLSAKQGRFAVLLAVGALTVGSPSAVMATTFDTGNPDIVIRWDNTIKYNIGMRAEPRNRKIGNDPNNQSSDYRFDRGDIVTNRVDVLSEFDAVFYKKYGFRVSGQFWYDQAYHDKYAANNPGTFNGLPYSVINPYPGNRYTNTIDRYYRGPSGELLDAFAFGSVDLGDVPVNVKLGQHNIYWGESIFSFIHGVSYSQGPVDIRKAFSTPGSEAKELFLPLNQISAQAQVNSELSVAGQLLFNWKPSRFPEGGTYIDVADPFFSGGGTRMFAGYMPGYGALYIPVGKPDEPNKFGDFGVSARWQPKWLDGTLGFYFRQFDDKLPWTLLGAPNALGLPSDIHLGYAKNVRMAGVSLAKEIAGASVGFELVHRWDGALLTNPNFGIGRKEGARGDTTHAILNSIFYFNELAPGGTKIYDSASLTAELAYSRWDRVTKNGDMFQAVGNAACQRNSASAPGSGDKWDGCATKDNLTFTAKFEPTLYQVMNGVDLKFPISVTVGVFGNSAVSFGGNQGSGNYSVGVSADIRNRYSVDLAYTDYFARFRADTGTYVTSSNGGGALLNDRGWVSATFKTTF